MDLKKERTCKVCKVVKPLTTENFKLNRKNSKSFAHTCVVCVRRESKSVLYRKYRKIIDDDRLKEIVESIHECVICGKKGRMFLDHDHKTMKVRGMLCSNCNLGLGNFCDDPELLEFAAYYLRDLNDFYKPE